MIIVALSSYITILYTSNAFCPLVTNTYAYFDVWINDEYVPIVLEIDDYPLKETYTYVDVPRLIMVIITLSCIAIGVVLLMRYIRMGCI